VIRSLIFVARLAAAWFGLFVVLALIAQAMPVLKHQDTGALFPVAVIVDVVVAITAFAHLRRVKPVAGRIDGSTIANRQRRQIEVPLDADETFLLLDEVIRELPRSEQIESARDSLQVRAKIKHPDSPGQAAFDTSHVSGWNLDNTRNQILATVTTGDGTSRIALICEPELGAWSDWFLVDHGVNLENAEAIVRAINRRIAERRRNERADAVRTSTEKELAVAKLSLLPAQVEPHFLYNTLASAQYLTRNDPPLADEMLGHLIEFLRRSLPRTEDALSTLGDELDRSRAYLEILKLRMGPRLELQLDVADERALRLALRCRRVVGPGIAR
jgi:hypothetical protein